MRINPMPPQSFLRECFDYDPETGALYWRARPENHFASRSKWRRHLSVDAGRRAGTMNRHGYFVVRLTYNGKALNRPVHRIVWAMHHGDTPSVLDHVNAVRSDNRLENLAPISQSENVRKKARKGTALIGAHYERSRRKWRAQIRMNGKQVYLGRYDTEAEASASYLSAAATIASVAAEKLKYARFPQ